MPLVVTCRNCGSKFQAPDRLAGKRGKCPKCSAVIELVATARPAAESQATSPAGASSTAAQRLYPCPDCGKMVSRRAQHCPHCGCPIGDPPEGTLTSAASIRPKSAPSRTTVTVEPSRKLLLAAAGGVVALVIVAALVAIVLKSAPPTPSPPAPVAEQPQPSAVPQVSQEQKEAWIKEVATARATDVDQLYQRLHSAKQTLDNVKQMADLMKTMSEPDGLSKLPTDVAPADAQPEPYESQLEALSQECEQYLRSNLTSGDFGRNDVLEAGSRWVKTKEAPAIAELDKLTNQSGLLQDADSSTVQPGAQREAQPTTPTTPPNGPPTSAN